jgi:hypothetical protein
VRSSTRTVPQIYVDAELIDQIDSLLELAQHTEEGLGALLGSPLPALFTGLSRLKGALILEQKRLLGTASTFSNIAVEIEESENTRVAENLSTTGVGLQHR